MLRMRVEIVELKKECKHLRWITVYSLGGRKFGFCNAGKWKTLPDSMPHPPHEELCPKLAGEDCRFYEEKKE